jgi:hypothetical protein
MLTHESKRFRDVDGSPSSSALQRVLFSWPARVTDGCQREPKSSGFFEAQSFTSTAHFQL